MAILGTTVASAASDWTQFRGPTRDGKAADGPKLLKSWPEGGPKQLWVNAGKLYIMTGYGRASTGKLLWRETRKPTPSYGIQAVSPVYADGRFYWMCLKLETGEVVAKTNAVGKGSLVFADGMLYTLGEKGMMGLVDPDTKNFRMVSSFKIPAGGSGPHWAHPSIANGRLYIRHGVRLFAYDIKAE